MFQQKVKIQNHMIIIFGALTNHIKKNIIPALYKLYETGYVSQTTPILCVGKEKMTKSNYIDLIEAEKNLPFVNTNILSGFLQLINYVKHDIESKDYTSLVSSVSRLDKVNNCKGNKILLFLDLEDNFEQLIENIKKSKITLGRGWTRVSYENNFFDNFEKTKKINKNLNEITKEDDIFRITNAPSKNVLENLIYLKNKNPIIGKVMNNECIDNVQITLFSKNDTTNINNYDEFGEINHVITSYGLDLMNYITLNSLKNYNEDAIKKETINFLKNISKPTIKDVVFGQYGNGKINDKKILAYKKQDTKLKESKTETFCLVKLKTKDKNWKNVPFYIRSAKALYDLIKIEFILKESKNNSLNFKEKNNIITFNIFPEEYIGINLNLITKTEDKTENEVILKSKINKKEIIDFYEEIIYDIIISEKVRFKTLKELEILSLFSLNLKKLLNNKKTKFPNYNAGDKPPKETELFIKKEKKEWI
ncbi:MAG: hypothetical protein ACOC3X_02760 [Nanoarchaeota archaeon]